jgi:hypothetical protein
MFKPLIGCSKIRAGSPWNNPGITKYVVTSQIWGVAARNLQPNNLVSQKLSSIKFNKEGPTLELCYILTIDRY